MPLTSLDDGSRSRYAEPNGESTSGLSRASWTQAHRGAALRPETIASLELLPILVFRHRGGEPGLHAADRTTTPALDGGCRDLAGRPRHGRGGQAGHRRGCRLLDGVGLCIVVEPEERDLLVH